MRRGDGEFGDLRLAAGAADRQQPAPKQWPAFEARLRDLGHSPRAIAHAFCSLSGPGTVAEALAVLERTQRASRPVALNFEIREPPGNYSTGKGLRITSVERDDHAIRVRYDFGITPRLGIGAAFAADRPRGAAKDDLGKVYRELGGGFFGLAAGDDSRGAVARACGGFTLPLPDSAASELRIRITSNATRPSIWETPAREAVVSLRK
jgi:hypothetical protein